MLLIQSSADTSGVNTGKALPKALRVTRQKEHEIAYYAYPIIPLMAYYLFRFASSTVDLGDAVPAKK
jgi:predicted phosphoribosyltransferase